MKDKNHTAILIEAEKAFDRVQHPFMIKMLNNLGIEGIYLNTRDATYSHTNITLSGERLFLSDQEQDRDSHSPYFGSLKYWKPSHSNQARKTKGIQIGKEKVKMFLLVDDLTYSKSLRLHQKLLELIKHSRVAGHKINIKKTAVSIH